LTARGLTGTTVAAADEYSIDDMIATANAYDRTALSYLSQLNTHSYSGTRRADLRALAAAHGKRLWMSEWGAGAGPHDHNAIAPALRLAEQIRRDMNDLRPTAWVYWQAVEHEQQNNWGFIHADFTGVGDEYWLTKQYYVMGHYSRFIRPGYQILGVDDMNTLAAYDQASGTLVVVYTNGTAQETSVRVDLSRLGRSAGSAAVYRTSATENLARLQDVPLSNGMLKVRVPAGCITTYVLAV
jgi:O-glycosyl hydrolase